MKHKRHTQLKFSSASSACPDGATEYFVVLTAGESQTLAKLGSVGALSLQGAALAALSSEGETTCRLEVLKCISSCDVTVDAAAATPLEVMLQCPREESVGEVCVDLALSATRQKSIAALAVEESNYLDENGVQERLAAAVKALVKERPNDPYNFIADFLTPGRHEIEPKALHQDTMSMQLPPVDVGFQRQVSPSILSGRTSCRTTSKSQQDPDLIRRLEKEVQQLRQHCNRQDTMLDEFHATISQLARDQPLTFTVLQYNILAHYLGDNTQPWLLYGADISDERRKLVHAKFVEKDDTGKYINKWPQYAKGILTDTEIQQVDDTQAHVFDWRVRRRRLLDDITSANCDIVSLEEMDEFEDFEEALSKDYSGIFRKRPRKSSKDGCAVFWRKSKFELAAEEGFDFVDRIDKSGKGLKDRTCILVLLRWCNEQYGRHDSRVLVVCTHLARNPEDQSQTKVRARQAAQLMKHLTDFTVQHHAGDVPVVLTGDLNAQHFGEVRGIARTVFQVCDHPCHQFLFRCADVPTGPTSVTDVRSVRIDAVMFQPSHLKILGVHVPELKHKIPDETHPSDHVPVRVQFEMKADHAKMQACARNWLECVAGQSHLLPLTDKELKGAFLFLDRDCSGGISKANLKESILELEMGLSVSPERQEDLLDCFPNLEISYEEFLSAYEVKFNSSRMGNIGDLEKAFEFFDSGKTGQVRPEDVHATFAEIVPIEFTKLEVDSLIAQVFQGQDGVDIHTFCEAMCKCNFHCSTDERPSTICQELVRRLTEMTPSSPKLYSRKAISAKF